MAELTEIRSNFYQKLCDRWTFFRGKSAYDYRNELLREASVFLHALVIEAPKTDSYSHYSELQKEFEEVHEIRHSILSLQQAYLENQATLLKREMSYIREQLKGDSVEGTIYENHLSKVHKQMQLIVVKQQEFRDQEMTDFEFPLYAGISGQSERDVHTQYVDHDDHHTESTLVEQNDVQPIRPVFPLDQLMTYFQDSFERMHTASSYEARYEFLETLWKVVHEICEYRLRRNPTSFELYTSSLRPLLDLVHSYFQFDMESVTENYDRWCHRLYALWDSSDRYDVNDASLLLFEALIYMSMYEDQANAAYHRLERVFQEVYSCIYDDFLSMIVNEDTFLAQVNGDIKKLYKKMSQHQVHAR